MREHGQATVEWLGLAALLAALLVGAMALLPGRLPGVSLAEALAVKLACAARLGAACRPRDALAAAYDPELAVLIRRHAPSIAYERGTRALPVDFRRCRRSPACADGPDRAGEVWGSHAGEPVTAFVRLIDRRPGGPLYIQYWLYFADSATARGVPILGGRGYHEDDWESYQVRIRPGADAESRASSHRGYAHHGGRRTWPSDAGLVRRPAWGPATGWLRVSGGSHAGQVVDGRAGDPGRPEERTTPPWRVRLVPIEPLAAGGDFAVTPPWRKRVYSDPEAPET